MFYRLEIPMRQLCLSLFSIVLCAATASAQDQDLVDRAQEFRTHLELEHYDMASAMMASDARRWQGAREGDGRSWSVGADTPDAWAGWHDHFATTRTEFEWREEDQSAIARFEETSEYYQLLERPAATTEIGYYFNDDGLIDGLLIRQGDDTDQGLTDEFLSWARALDEHEIDHLMPGGQINPTGNHPPRFRALLDAWRADTGRSPIE